MEQVTAQDALKLFEKRKEEDYKGNFGKCVIFAGSKHFPGALNLAVLGAGASRMGSGYVAIATIDSISASLAPFLFESTIAPQKEENGFFEFSKERVSFALENATSVAAGMGMGKSDEVRKLVLFLLENFHGNLLLDADALNSISEDDLKLKRVPTLSLTPHLGEFKRLFGKDVKDFQLEEKGEILQSLSQKYHLNLLLKGHETLISNGESLKVSTSGTPAQGKGGSGDLLSGFCAGLMARKPPFESLQVGTFILGEISRALARESNDHVLSPQDLKEPLYEFFQNLK